MMNPDLPTSPEELLLWERERGIEQLVGMGALSYRLPKRLNGRLRARPEDFIVSEVTRDGSVATTVTYSSREEATHPIYIMTKVNSDTLAAMRQLSSAIGLKPWEMDRLGLKDKRAQTFQFVSPKKRCETPPKLRGSEWGADLMAISSTPLRPCDLRGNLFWVTIRLRAPMLVDEIRDVLGHFSSKVAETGLLNFFGYQRFGGRKPVNHIAGYLIAKRDYEAACKVILCTPSRTEPRELTNVRSRLLERRNREDLARVARSPLSVERALARNFMRYECDARKSILHLPANLLRFLLEAFSSFLFNDTIGAMSGQLLSGGIREGALYSQLDNEGGVLTTYAMGAPWNRRRIGEDLRLRRAVPAVACPGFLAERAIEGKTRETMAQLGIDCSSFHFQERPEAGYPGQVRAAVVFPRLISAAPIDARAVFLSFFLPRSSYATVLLRELLSQRTTRRGVTEP